MTIEKIACPILNRPLSTMRSVEVFVRFNKAENPVSIACPYYGYNGRCGFEDATSRGVQECIYNRLTKIVRAPVQK